MNKTTLVRETMDEWPLRNENPARQALAVAGITHLRQLTKFSEKELLKLHGVGPKAIRLLREALAIRGLSFAQPDRSSTTRKRVNQQPPRRASKKSS